MQIDTCKGVECSRRKQYAKVPVYPDTRRMIEYRYHSDTGDVQILVAIVVNVACAHAANENVGGSARKICC
jgi:hypothetical protein